MTEIHPKATEAQARPASSPCIPNSVRGLMFYVFGPSTTR